MLWAVCGLLLLSHLSVVRGFYLPGTYPREFRKGDPIAAEANSLVSSETEVPFPYYSMPFCQPPEGVKKAANFVNPGTILLGIRVENSPYTFSIMEETRSQPVCKPPLYNDNAYPGLNEKEVKMLRKKIRGQYRVRLILDNLPITTYDLELGPESVRPGFDVGYQDKDKFYVNNHLMFKILVHETYGQYAQGAEGSSTRRLLQEGVGGAAPGATPGEKLYMIVGFEVVACSIKREPGAEIKAISCPNSPGAPGTPEPQEVTPGAKIVYTYDVFWDTSSITWASRWDAYLKMPGGKVHWFSILNSLMVVVVMTCIVAMIMMRTIRRDLQQYEQLLVDGGGVTEEEEFGWKVLSGDVFRAPAAPMSLCVQFGSGVQILLATFVTLVFAALGFLSPASRGSLLSALLLMYLLLAVAAGFTGVWLWGTVNRSYDGWMKVCWRVACLFPGVTAGIVTTLNFALWATGSSGAVPIGFFLSAMFLWLLVSIPLSYSGGMIAAKREIKPYPTRTNQIPRPIPPPHWASHPLMLFFAAGLLPFGTIFVELYFAMTSLWQGYFYYIFGFLFLVAVLTLVITVEVSIVCTYVQLCAEDYSWWWRSYYRGASISVYVLIYSIGFLVNTLNNLTGVLPIALYMSYMGLLVWCMSLALGSVGFFSSFIFVYKIFKSAKAD